MLKNYAKGAARIARRYSSNTGVWSDFSKRASSLKLVEKKHESDLLKGIDPEVGPVSYEETPSRRQAYHSPIAIDETFAEAYKLLESESAQVYQEIEKLQQSKDVVDADVIAAKLVEAEINNPEVMFNIENYPSSQLDKSQPVYRDYLKKIWQSHDQMLTMQRLEQLHVFPDTLATLDPRAEVKVKFLHNTRKEFANWVEPGTIVPAFSVQYPPEIQIQEFDIVPENQLYSVVLVNPDTPDLQTNSFKTTLHYGLCNVPLNYNDNTINAAKLLKLEDQVVFSSYEPLTPEKNIGNQRACLWVFRQDGAVSIDQLSLISRDKFDIRAFVEENKLTAIGGHVWRQAFDRSVPGIRKEFNMEKGRVFVKIRNDDPVVEV